jgi:hypothetical protein
MSRIKHNSLLQASRSMGSKLTVSAGTPTVNFTVLCEAAVQLVSRSRESSG